MTQFDDSIFSEGSLSFGHLLARDEELSIWSRKPIAVRLTTYHQATPTIYATAQALHSAHDGGIVRPKPFDCGILKSDHS